MFRLKMAEQSYFYTETAFIHQGDVAYLLELVRASARVGAHGIKFQVIGSYEAFMSKVNPNYEPFKKAMISQADWERVFQLCKSLSLDVIFMPCDCLAAELANGQWRHYIRYLDIHPINFIYQPILEIIREGGIEIILGMGGRTKEEVDEKISFFGSQIKVLMFGHQAFPTQLHQSALAKIVLLREAYPDLQIGYADHSPWQSEWGRHLQSVAYMLGARVFEKHIALVAGEERFDYITSVDPSSIQAMIDDIRSLDDQAVEVADLHRLNASEVKYTSRQLKAVASRDLEAETSLSRADISYKMIESELGLSYLQDPAGRVLKKPLARDYPFLSEDLA